MKNEVGQAMEAAREQALQKHRRNLTRFSLGKLVQYRVRVKQWAAAARVVQDTCKDWIERTAKDRASPTKRS